MRPSAWRPPIPASPRAWRCALARAGTTTPQVARLLLVDDLGPGELAYAERVADASTPEGKRLQEALGARREAARKIAAAAGPARTSVKPLLEEASPEVLIAIDQVMPLLESFPALAAHEAGVVAVVPRKRAATAWLHPFLVDRPRLRQALRHALAGPPYHMTLAEAGPGREVERLSSAALGELAEQTAPKSQYVLLYDGVGDGVDAALQLTLYDVGRMEAYQSRGTVSGRFTGLTRWNMLFAGALAVILGLLLAWALQAFVLAGDIEVDIKRDRGAERETLGVVVSRSRRRPRIDGVKFEQHEASHQPRRRQRHHTQVGARTAFHRVPAGWWWVHLYGVQVRGGDIKLVSEQLSQKVRVKTGETVYVKLDLNVDVAEYRVKVTDGRPLAGAKVYIDGAKDKAERTNQLGQASLYMPIGTHVVYVEASDFTVERKLTVTSSKAQVLMVDVAWERKVAAIKIAELHETAEAALGITSAPRLPRGGVTSETRLESPGGSDSGLDLPVYVEAPATGAPIFDGRGRGMVSIARMESVTPPAVMATPPREPRLPSLQSYMEARQAARVEAVSLPHVETPAATVHASAAAVHASAAAVPASAPGLIAGRYERSEELGRGAMGVVFKARDRVLERDVALKIVGEELRATPGALAMFLQEAKAMAALNHPNLVTVFDQGQAGADTFMVMEFIDGRTLAQIVEGKGKLPVGRVLDIAEQVAAGLAYAHGKRIIHRDIKPANIFVSVDGVVKIGDFGLARAVRQLQITHTKVCGTPLYMSPEQIRGSEVDFRSDLYALGCTLYELLTGRPPFTEGEVMFHHMYTPPAAPSAREPGVPAEVDALILACLQKEKEARMESAERLRSLLQPLKARYAG
jgi:hypothetical protein